METKKIRDIFPDQKLAQFIAGILRKEVEDFVTDEQLQSMTSLEVTNKGVESIAGLENLTELENLQLSDHKVSDLSPLRNLSLSTCQIENNKIALSDTHVGEVTAIKILNSQGEVPPLTFEPAGSGGYENGELTWHEAGDHKVSWSDGNFTGTITQRATRVPYDETVVRFTSVLTQNNSPRSAATAVSAGIELWRHDVNRQQRFILKYNTTWRAYQIWDLNEAHVMIWDRSRGRWMRMGPNQNIPQHFWQLERIRAGVYRIANNFNINYVMDVNSSNTNNGTGISVHPRNGTQAQEFLIEVLEERTRIVDIFPDQQLAQGIADHFGRGVTNAITIQELNNRTGTITLANRGIVNLEGMQYFTRINSLNLNDNDIIDIRPISRLINLGRLDINNNRRINNISLISQLTNLNDLSMRENELSDISFLSSLSRLNRLYLNDNQIRDIGALNNLTSLQHLMLQNNQISDLNPIKERTFTTFNATNQQIILEDISLGESTEITIINRFSRNPINFKWITDGTYENGRLTWRSPGNNEVRWEAANHNGTMNFSGTIRQAIIATFADVFPDPALAQGMAEAFGRAVTDRATSEDLNNRTASISLDGRGIVSLEGMQYLTNLTRLELRGNEIININALNGLTRLTHLFLTNNRISDLSPIKERTFTGFDATGQQITLEDIPLGKSEGIAIIGRFRTNPVIFNWITPGTYKDKLLTWDTFGNNEVRWGAANHNGTMNFDGTIRQTVTSTFADIFPDLALAQGMAEAFGRTVTDPVTPEILNNRTDEINLNDRGIVSLKGIEHLTSLRRLQLRNNEISDLSALGELTSLQALFLDSNKIRKISALNGLTNLRQLWLAFNEISDISALSGLTNLWQLWLRDNKIRDISILSNLTNLRELWLYDNEISDLRPLPNLSFTRLYLGRQTINLSRQMVGKPTKIELYNIDGSRPRVTLVSGEGTYDSENGMLTWHTEGTNSITWTGQNGFTGTVTQEVMRELVELDRTVLGAIAEFKRLNHHYSITSDMFATFIGKINTYAEVGKESFYQSTFKSTGHGNSLPLGEFLQFPVDQQGLYESICCGAMGVTSDEFFRIGKYCFGNTDQRIKADETTVARLYRMGKIPQMLGLSFTEVELLWKLMSGGEDTLLQIVGGSSSLKTLDIIAETEMILDWMSTHQLDVVSLQAMVTDQYSRTATPELYNFLLKVYQAVSGISREGHQETLLIEHLCRALAADFNIKANVMEQTLHWLEKSNVRFTLQGFWEQLELYFSISHEDELVSLEEQPDLLKWCQQVSQYVLIVRWCGLSEQDLMLLSEYPKQLFNEHHTEIVPSLYLLLVLSRLKEWQQRVQVSSDEAMRYFAQVNAQMFTADDAVKLLAHIHGWNQDYTATMNDYLLGEGEYPKSFEQIFTLETWVNLGYQLKIGSRTLGELADMAAEDKTAESIELITSVANSMMAAAQGDKERW